MLTNLVKMEWGGGRVLMLPGGLFVKPLQKDSETGHRVLISRFTGSILLTKPTGGAFNLNKPGNLQPGNRWPGPKTTGLECAIDASGALKCTWYHPTSLGRDEITEQLRGPDRSLAAGFRVSRPFHSGGRVRITANGHITTNRQESDDSWAAYYVGWVDPAAWKSEWQKWIRRGSQ
jgi:hypothetical protein